MVSALFPQVTLIRNTANVGFARATIKRPALRRAASLLPQ